MTSTPSPCLTPRMDLSDNCQRSSGCFQSYGCGATPRSLEWTRKQKSVRRSFEHPRPSRYMPLVMCCWRGPSSSVLSLRGLFEACAKLRDTTGCSKSSSVGLSKKLVPGLGEVTVIFIWNGTCER